MNKTSLTLCIASVLIVGLTAMNVQQSRDRNRLKAEIAEARETVRRWEEIAHADREALRLARAELVAPERETPETKPAMPLVISTSLPPAPLAPEPIAAATLAMTRYLGEPVAAPGDIDPKYSAEGILTAFKALCQARGIAIQKLAIDTTEFPFLLHGVLNDREFLRQLDSELRNLPGYSYSGSVTGSTKEGGAYFALNIMPSKEYPQADAETIRRRLMIRLQMLAVAWTDPQSR
jgi:hypothetical protein